MSDPVEPLKSSVVRFYHANGNVVGAGFLVADRYVLTCAHVVAAALTLPENTEVAPEQSVQVDFPLLDPGQKLEASVVFWLPVSHVKAVEDMAVLRLAAATPTEAKCTSLHPAPSYWEHSLVIFGFPQGHDRGIWATGVFRGPNDKGWIQFDSLMSEDRPVEKGFSGAPIWDQALKAVVGMAVAAEKRRESVNSAYMIPQELLRRPLNYIRQQTLLDIFQDYESIPGNVIQFAYGLCRSQNAVTPVQKSIPAIIDELANATAGAQQDEDKLVQFVAALWLELDSQMITAPRESLEKWGARFAKDFEVAKAMMQALKIKHQEQRIAPNHPMLLVNIQEDVSRESLSIEAWIVLDPEKYNSKTFQGSRRLLFSPEDEDCAHLSEQSISYRDLPILIESYLMQLCGGSEYECDPSDLTLYFVLPPSLLNQSWERLIPGEEEDPIGIGYEDCPQVMLALQNRSGLGGFRANSRWKKAWKFKDVQANVPAHDVFADGQGLKEAGVIGFQKLTSLNPQSDPQLLAKQGIPLAVWVRDNQIDKDWAPVLLDQVLSSPLKNVPKQVLEIRRNTDTLDSEAEYAQSPELGHHLAILWDDPNRVPPTTNAPLSAASL
ncbi:trypsin-like peptidase domain-containing protein [Leptothoe sp. LEGE 181152]|nr:trypsin-like peptidase domain-containing protein [Leptothoe sp. LEGE 181152]